MARGRLSVELRWLKACMHDDEAVKQRGVREGERKSEGECLKKDGMRKCLEVQSYKKMCGFRSRQPAPKRFSSRCLCRFMSKVVEVICYLYGYRNVPKKSYSRYVWSRMSGFAVECVDSGPAFLPSRFVEVYV